MVIGPDPQKGVLMTELLNTRLGQYHLTEIVRRGGMSTVYKAYQDSLGRFVAVKVMSSHRDPQFAARFKREARAIAALQHHNILPIFDYGEQGDLLYLVLQYVENGTTLADMLGKPMAPAVALRLTSHVLNALDYAHKRGVIHRDIKPGNVLMPSPTWPMLADFGIAKLMNDNQSRLTLANQIIGTAAYMAPEQATGRPIDARTDLYAAGVVLYELVTGRVPFDADTPMAVLTKHVYEAPPPARALNPKITTSVEEALRRALEKDPNERFQTAAEMSAELTRVASLVDQEIRQAQSSLTGMFEAGLAAFQSRRHDEALDLFGRVKSQDPERSDVDEMIEMTRAEKERALRTAQLESERVREEQARMAAEKAAPKQPANPNKTVLLRFDDEALSASPPQQRSVGSPEQQAATTHIPAPPAPASDDPYDTAKLRDLDHQIDEAEQKAKQAAAAESNRSAQVAWVIAGLVLLALVAALFVLLR